MASKPPRVSTATEVTDKDRADAIRLIRRLAADPDDAHTILTALGLDQEEDQ